VDRDSFGAWIELYERAWRTAGTDLLAKLFAADATYKTAPYEPPFRGLEAIAKMWEDERDSPDENFDMSYEIVAVEGSTAVAMVKVLYGQPIGQEYSDIWIVRFDEGGRCVAFEEWPFWPPGQRGGWIDGPKQ
jgi:ketosteroid isomerase-like protein